MGGGQSRLSRQGGGHRGGSLRAYGRTGDPWSSLGDSWGPRAGFVLSQDDQDDSSWFWAYHPDVWSQIRMMLVLGVVGT